MKNLVIRIVFVYMVFYGTTAEAESLKQKVNRLEILQLAYGNNNIKIGNKNIVISRTHLENGNAWNADIYSVLKKEKGRSQTAKIKNDDGSIDTKMWYRPHTGEDVIDSVFFFESTNKMDLYLLRAKREYKENPYESVQVKFTLYVLKTDELNKLNFQKLDAFTSQKKYCNSDSAALHEFGLALPAGTQEFKCVN